MLSNRNDSFHFSQMSSLRGAEIRRLEARRMVQNRGANVSRRSRGRIRPLQKLRKKSRGRILGLGTIGQLHEEDQPDTGRGGSSDDLFKRK